MGRFLTGWILALVVLAPTASAQRAGPAVSLAGVGHDRGGPDARVFIVEFLDFGCGYCAKFAAETYPKLDSAYIAPGVVRWKMVPFVTGLFRHSREVAEAAECAAEQGAFWPMHDLLYARRREWMAAKDIRGLVTRYARTVGLDLTAFARCGLNPGIRQRILGNDAIASRLGIRGTPTFFVSGRVIPGAVPFEVFQQVIREAIR